MSVTIERRDALVDSTAEQGPVILGVDISTKCGTALLNYRFNAAHPKLELDTLFFETEVSLEKARAKKAKVKPGPTPHHQFARWQQYEETFHGLVLKTRPDLAVIEGYGFASQSLGTLVELGTHLKRVLFRAGIPWVEVTPNALKKFVMGVGKAEKNAMMLAMYKRFGVDTNDDNQADAAALAYAGAALLGRGPTLPAAHLAALDKARLQLIANA